MALKSRSLEQATHDYEHALARFTKIDKQALETKHKEMAKDTFAFLRATYYRWAELFPLLCPSLMRTATVFGVGDLHVQNFGTWRDAEGRLVWGIDDFDEADTDIPVASDLVRLAVSAILTKSLTLDHERVCHAVLDGYEAGLAGEARPFVLDDRHEWLRELAREALKPPKAFWHHWLQMASRPLLRKDVSKAARHALWSAFPDHRDPDELRQPNPQKPKGLGSLGKPRFYGYTPNFLGGPVAREAKALAPPATRIERTKRLVSSVDRIQRVAIRSRDPEYRRRGKWVLKPILATTGRIELDALKAIGDEQGLLGAMGCETANIHRGSQSIDVLKQALRALRRSGTLREAAQTMLESTKADHREWKSEFSARIAAG